MERQKFEESWKDAFREAEVTPSDNLWTNIELELEKADGDKMKRRILFYKMLAAASVVFAMAFAGAGVYFKGQHDQARQALVTEKLNATDASKENNTAAANESNSNTTPSTTTTEDAANNSVAPDTGAKKSNIAANKDQAGHNASTQAERTGNSAQEETSSKNAGQQLAANALQRDKDTNASNSATQQQVPNPVRGTHGEDAAISNNNNKSNGNSVVAYGPMLADADRAVTPKPTLDNTKKNFTVPARAQEEVDPVVAMIARLNEEERRLREAGEGTKSKKDKSASSDERLWTSLGFAAGSFSTVTSGTSSLSGGVNSLNADFAKASNTVVQDQSKASGVSYSVGLNVGARIANRWVLQGGVNYLTQSSDYTSNSALRDQSRNYSPSSINQLSSEHYNQIVTVAEYNVNNNLQYINVPLQAGYLLLNRKLGLQFNAGVSTDLFLQNTITPEQGTFEKTTQKSGEDSPYRAVNFSGLMGTEISYRFATHYRVALNPGVRYPFNSIYKSTLGIEALPITFDIGLRFRYIFH